MHRSTAGVQRDCDHTHTHTHTHTGLHLTQDCSDFPVGRTFLRTEFPTSFLKTEFTIVHSGGGPAPRRCHGQW